jgi:transcriptional regulator with PAS, ATPase and Fis domain
MFAWVGTADLEAAGVVKPPAPPRGDGPIAAAVAARVFDHVVLLDSRKGDESDRYAHWLRARSAATLEVSVLAAPLPRPTDYEAIYRQACAAVDDTLATLGPDARLTFHLSPGTPAMSSVWIILGKTRNKATLIQSSPEQGVVEAVVPFELTADFLPDLLRARDEALARKLQGEIDPSFKDIIHRSGVMESVIRRAQAAAVHAFPVLLEGETGTGKELFARALHRASPRRAKPFVAVNCGAIPANLVEAQLFGWIRGAFTGATDPRPGLFEQANDGTLFLDELGELPLDIQVRLLRALQEGEVRRVGDTEVRKVDVRVIAATHRDLLTEVQAGRCREDLFYRLAVLALRIPPLREREGDVVLLAEHMLAKLAGPPAGRKKLSAGARKVLLRHPWPGNVRELQATLHRAWVWSSGATLDAAEIEEALLGRVTTGGHDARGATLGDGFDVREVLRDTARHYLQRAMREASGNKTHAAKLLGLPSYQTLTNWLAKYDVDG